MSIYPTFKSRKYRALTMKLIYLIFTYYIIFGIENLVHIFTVPLLRQQKNSFTMQPIKINTGMIKTNF